jgi:hypothetical protein
MLKCYGAETETGTPQRRQGQPQQRQGQEPSVTFIGAPELHVFEDDCTVTFIDPECCSLANPAIQTCCYAQTQQPLKYYNNGLNYFEVTIININAFGKGMTIGLSRAKNVLENTTVGIGMSPRTIGLSSKALLYSGTPSSGERYGSRCE